MPADITLEDTGKLPSLGPLSCLNRQFHEQLCELKAATRRQVDSGQVPIVVRLDSRLILVLGDERSVLDVNEAYYHQLKALAHIPLLLFTSALNGTMSEHIRAAVVDTLLELQSDENLPDTILATIQEAASRLFESLHWPALEFSAVRQFNEELQPAFQSLIALAARDEAAQTLSALHRLKSTVCNESLWKQTFYVVCAGHQPRYKQLCKLLLRRWVFEQTQSSTEVEQRVIYGEALESVNAARELVVNRLVNGLIGDAFLHSPLSMNQDVLGEAGEMAVESAFRAEGHCIGT